MSSYDRIKAAAKEADRDLEDKPDKIDKLWAFLAQGPNGGDGIIAYTIPDMGTTPLVTGKESNVKRMLSLAKETSERSGIPFRIVEFSVRKDVTGDFTHE